MTEPGRLHRIATLVGGLVLAVALAGCQDEAPPPREAARPFRIETARPVSTAESVTLTGAIQARTESSLSFRTSGRIVERLVDVGDRVTNGQLLARLDPELQRADVQSAEAAVANANASVDQATAAFGRAESLFQRGYTTRREFEAADQALKVARANREAADARLASAREALSFADLRADADGIVTARQLDVGETAQAAATVFRVAVDGARDAVFDIYEGLLLEGREPPAVIVALVSDPAVTARGSIRQIAPSVDPQNATVRVKVGLDTVPASMTLGAPVTGTATLPTRSSIVLPASAMTSADGEPAVWVLDPATGEVAMRRVEVAAYAADTVTLGGGLDAGESVVTDGTKFLRPGEKIANPDAGPVGLGDPEKTR